MNTDKKMKIRALVLMLWLGPIMVWGQEQNIRLGGGGGPGGAVNSVNGQSGTVVLGASDVGAAATSNPLSQFPSGPAPIVTHGLTVSGAGGVYGITNLDGSFCITNQINHSFDLWTTNGDHIASNGVVGAYMAWTNGCLFVSSNATIGGLLSVLSGNSTTLSNFVNNGWFTNFGGFTNTGPMRVDGVVTLNGNVAGAASNYWNLSVVKGFAATTNAGSLVVDVSLAEALIVTNGTCQILGITGKDSSGKTIQWAHVAVTNSLGLGAAFQTTITFASGFHVIGQLTLNLTNQTDLDISYQPPNGPTNVYVTPDF